MAGKRFKDTEKKLNIKKVLLILMIPVVIAGGYFGYKEFKTRMANMAKPRLY